MAPPKSVLWLHFQKLPKQNDTVRCNLCSKILKTSGNTSNMSNHLKQKHKTIFEQVQKTNRETSSRSESSSYSQESQGNPSTPSDSKKPRLQAENIDLDLDQEPSQEELLSNSQNITVSEDITNLLMKDKEEKKISSSTLGSSASTASVQVEPGSTSLIKKVTLRQPLINSSMQNLTAYADGGSKNSELTEAIVNFIVKDNMPFSTVEGTGFLALMKKLTPLYKVPTRNTIKNRVDEKYHSVSQAFKNILQDIKFLSLTMDIWTADMQTKSFLGITVHFILEMKLVSATIGITELSESHTASYIASELTKILETWNINKEKVVAVVTDNAANIVKAIHDSFPKGKHVPCFAHTLNLLCENSIKNTEGFNAMIEKVRSIVVYFKRSVKASDHLRRIQKESGIAEGNMKKVVLDVKTRWNSTYYMIERFLELASTISTILFSNIDAPLMLSAQEIDELKELKKLLHPLEKMTKEISGANYVTISKIIPLTACLYKQYENNTSTYNIAKNLKIEILKEFQKRFGFIEKSIIPAVSTLIDPRFKNLHFNDPIAVSNAIRCLKAELAQTACCSSSDSEAEGSPNTTDLEEEEAFDLWAHHKKIAHSHGKKKKQIL